LPLSISDCALSLPFAQQHHARARRPPTHYLHAEVEDSLTRRPPSAPVCRPPCSPLPHAGHLALPASERHERRSSKKAASPTTSHGASAISVVAQSTEATSRAIVLRSDGSRYDGRDGKRTYKEMKGKKMDSCDIFFLIRTARGAVISLLGIRTSGDAAWFNC
jgi:hypothetical protein